jgi:hypothetical protein
MNSLYFACADCKVYIDAGYRWAYWELDKTGLVARGKQVNVESVLAAESYWNPPKEEGSRWLYEGVFPPLRQFLEEHKSHQMVFGEIEDFTPSDDDYYIDWMQIGYLMMPTPRYLVEVLGFESWEQVGQYMQEQEIPPAWWEVTWSGDPSPHEQGKRKFEELVRAKHGS